MKLIASVATDDQDWVRLAANIFSVLGAMAVGVRYLLREFDKKVETKIGSVMRSHMVEEERLRRKEIKSSRKWRKRMDAKLDSHIDNMRTAHPDG